MTILRSLLPLLLFTALTIPPALSQVNTESLRREREREGVHGQLGLNIAFQSGNSEYLKYNVGGRLDFRNDQVYTFAVANYQRGKQADALYLHDAFLHLRFVYGLDSSFKPEVFAQKEFNDFIRLKDRQLAGAGLRITLFDRSTDTTSFTLNVGVGGMFESELLSIEPEQLRTDLVRSTNYLAMFWQIRNAVALTATGYYQVALSRMSDFRILGDASLTFTITDFLAFGASFNYRLDNEPPPDVKRYDLKLSNGVTVLF